MPSISEIVRYRQDFEMIAETLRRLERHLQERWTARDERIIQYLAAVDILVRTASFTPTHSASFTGVRMTKAMLEYVNWKEGVAHLGLRTLYRVDTSWELEFSLSQPEDDDPLLEGVSLDCRLVSRRSCEEIAPPDDSDIRVAFEEIDILIAKALASKPEDCGMKTAVLYFYSMPAGVVSAFNNFAYLLLGVRAKFNLGPETVVLLDYHRSYLRVFIDPTERGLSRFGLVPDEESEM